SGPEAVEESPSSPVGDAQTARSSGMARRLMASPPVLVSAGVAFLLVVLIVTVAVANRHRHTPTPAPSTTTGAAPPTSTPPTQSQPTATPTPVLPAGWYMYHDPTGFSVAAPTGWRISREGTIVYFRDATRVLGIDQSPHPQFDPVADWT